jgi:ABC-type transporter Mla MlaB component
METLKLQGEFDLPAAIALQARLVGAPAERALQVDFSHVEVHSVALAGLAAWLSSRGRKVMAIGLQEAERRLLKYLGFSDAFACEA